MLYENKKLIDHGMKNSYQYLGIYERIFQGAGSAAFESVIGLESPDNDELESKLTYQAGRFTGNVIAGAASIIEILEGLTVIGGSNF